MKNYIIICLFLIGSCISTVHAQAPRQDFGIAFKALFLDYQSQNGGSFGNFKDYHSGFEIGLYKDLTDQLTLNVPFKMGVVNANEIPEGYDYKRKTIYGLDAQLHYHFGVEESQLEPYLLAGLGYVAEKNGTSNLQIPIGAGFRIKIFDQAYFNYQLEYRYSLEEDRNNFNHGIGFIYMLGPDMGKKEVKAKKHDQDGDGVEDALDLCPQVVGLPQFNGCPDTDGDGVPDYQDLCPNDKGPVELRGCPDSDGDGVPDNEDKCPEIAGDKESAGCPLVKDSDGDGIIDSQDKCPNIAGPASNNGCPDSRPDRDGDGIPDSEDRCPTKAGLAQYQGCPDSDGDGIPDSNDACPYKAGPTVYNGCPDTDGDGVHDGRDRCPNQKGTVALNGCPEISKQDRETLDIAMRAVQFDTGRATLKSESYDVLGQIANIMRRYPDFNLSIEGHTDNTGSSSNNQRLSEQRAKACYEYLIKQGVSSSRLRYVGYGESRPVANNNSLRGRTLNRRVEFKLVAPQN